MVRHSLVRAFIPLTLLSALCLSGCGEAKKSDAYSGPGYKSSGSSYAGLMFAVVDKDFTSSQILYNEFATGDIKTLSTGESGDPFVRWTGGKAYLFNRASTSLNFRTLDPRQNDVSLSAQIATPEAGLGDPHDAVMLSDGRMLLALYSAGKIIVINPADGTLLQAVTADWDFGNSEKAQLRPEAFLVKDVVGGKDIYVMHQGLDSAFTADGTQQVFRLHDDGKTVTVIDQDDGKAKVQGIALPVKSPSGFYPAADGSYLAYSECDMYAAAGCKAGFVTIDLAAKTAAVTYDTSDLIGNGGIAQGEGDVFYALVAKGKKATDAKVISRIDLKTDTAADFFTFKGTRGCCSLTFDDSTKTLYSGDVSGADPNAGVLLAFPDDASVPTEATLPGNPYGGLLVPK